MQPIAILAVAVGVVMVLARASRWPPCAAGPGRPASGAGTCRGACRWPAPGRRWRHLARTAGQTPVTHNVMYLTATVLLVGAFLCAVAGAGAATRGR